MISLGMIVRNAEATLERCLESVVPYVDEIVIGLGGESTDGTEEIARKYAQKVIQLEWHDDFALARNTVLAACEGDYYLWLDADDELIGGEHMQQLIEEHPEVDAFYWGYDYSRDEAGVNTCYLIRERLVKLSPEWGWVGKVHEVFMGPPNHTMFLVPDMLVKHYPQAKSPTRNLDILYRELEAGEPNPDPRILMYLGSENASRGNLHEALLHFHRYVQLSGWDEEKYQAQHRIADIYRVLGNFERSRISDLKAISIRPDWPDAYLGLAETAYYQGNYRECVEWTKAASTKETPQTLIILNPRDYDYHPNVFLGLAYAQLGDIEMAIHNLETARSIRQTPEVTQYLRAFYSELEARELVKSVKNIWEHLAKHDEWLKARSLWDSIPKIIEKVPELQEDRGFTYRVTEHIKNPELMLQRYVNNDNWVPADEPSMSSERWLEFPRLKYAIQVAKNTEAKSIVDLGSADGFITLPLAKYLEDKVAITGVDIDPRAIQLANERAVKWGLAHTGFIVGDVQTYRSDGEKFFDLGLLFEVIEHVVDPTILLDNLEKSARHIAITTPYLTWDGPRSDWNKEELKPHLRIFDLEDIERMLGGRGRIWNLYRENHGSNSWIFADYHPGESTQNHITILAPGSPEAWSPKSFEKEGLGGSETAVIRLAEEFAGLGSSVSVYSRMASEGYFNRVRYRDQERYVPQIHSDLFIAWRAPELIETNPNAARSILWMHDTDCGDRLTPARAARFEGIVVLTEWHKQHMMKLYPFVPEEKFWVCPNGVDVKRFEQSQPRNPKRVIYSSSPDRGLDIILENIWPKVIEEVPDAELHIFYGWNNFDKYIGMVPGLAEFKSKILNLLANSRNVVLHGRVPQDELAREMMKSGVWLYPTYFPETYCITAVEAQLAGLVPVTNDLAALAETVKTGSIIKGDVRNPEVQAEYAKATVWAMDVIDRKFISKSAPAVSWSEVAQRWSDSWLMPSTTKVEKVS
jgi:glycosyltransferase involved in cell wall biosynthesis/2-polyprenyl-3-methyl-5-hydroxy-6-metoxy-1,4-benzoquinol methylase